MITGGVGATLTIIRNDVKHGQYHTWTRVPLQFLGYSLGFYGSLLWDAGPPIEASNITLIPYALGGASKNFETKAKTDNILRGGGLVNLYYSFKLL